MLQNSILRKNEPYCWYQQKGLKFEEGEHEKKGVCRSKRLDEKSRKA